MLTVLIPPIFKEKFSPITVDTFKPTVTLVLFTPTKLLFEPRTVEVLSPITSLMFAPQTVVVAVEGLVNGPLGWYFVPPMTVVLSPLICVLTLPLIQALLSKLTQRLLLPKVRQLILPWLPQFRYESAAVPSWVP